MASVASGGAADRIIERIFCNVPRAGWGSFARYFSTSAEPDFVLARADALAFFITGIPGNFGFRGRLAASLSPHRPKNLAAFSRKLAGVRLSAGRPAAQLRREVGVLE